MINVQLSDLQKVLKNISQPQLKLWFDLKVYETLGTMTETIDPSIIIYTIHGDLAFSTVSVRSICLQGFSDDEIQNLSNLRGLGYLGRKQIQQNLEHFRTFFDLKYSGWKLKERRDYQPPGKAAGGFGKELISLGIPHEYQRLMKYQIMEWYNSQQPSFLVHMPTGSGKTRTANEFLVDIFRLKSSKVLWLTQRSELLIQSSESFRKIWVEKGDHSINLKYHFGEYDDWFSRNAEISEVVYASFDMLRSRFKELHLNFDLVVVDEAHFSLAETYFPLLTKMLLKSIKCLGLTATPSSSNDDDFFSIRSFFISSFDLESIGQGQFSFKALQEKQYLAEITYNELNIEKSHFHRNSKRLNDAILNYSKEIMSAGHNAIIFAIDKTHAIALCIYLNMNEVKAEVIVGETSIPDRQHYIEQFEQGEISILINHEILSTGVDIPKLNSILVLRDFGSNNIAMQVVGRALRGPKNGGNRRNTVTFPNTKFIYKIENKY